VKLDAYTVVFLRRPPDAPELSDEELDGLQQGHLAFLARMRQEGHALITGPLSGQPDASLRGIAIYRTSVEEARRLAEQDPSVKAGPPAACPTWLLPAGTLGDRPASAIEIDDA
jgi:YCII-related domain.